MILFQDSSVSDGADVIAHTITLDSLTEPTTYYYIVGSEDEAGNIETSTEDSFFTSIE